MEISKYPPVVKAAYSYVLSTLRPIKHYPYHNVAHTLDVTGRAERLAVAEGLDLDSRVDVVLAALFHDTGFVEAYDRNEAIGARIARDWLRSQGHPPERIARVESTILATIVFSPTSNILEEIIQDADLDNLGRDDCFQKMERVEKELREYARLDQETILKIFRRLHTEYRFHTRTSIRERRLKKLQNAARFERIVRERS